MQNQVTYLCDSQSKATKRDSAEARDRRRRFWCIESSMKTKEARTSATRHDSHQPDSSAFGSCEVPPQGRESAISGMLWGNDAYPAVLQEAWADQFRNWGISPEVAASRGYSVILGEGEKPAGLKEMRISGATRQGKRLRSSLAGTGPVALILPWHSVESVRKKAEEGATDTRLEIRPLRPGAGHPEQELVGGAAFPVGLHPAVPAEWIDSAPRIVIVAGVLNADALVSAYLRSLGFEDFKNTKNGSHEAGLLQGFMASIPVEKRVLILSVTSADVRVESFIRLALLGMHDREGWIITDTVGSQDPLNYRQLTDLQSQLLQKEVFSSVGFMTFTPVSESPESGSTHTALALSLGAGGTWEALENSSVQALPVLSQQELAVGFGDWRIHSSGTFTEEYVSPSDGSYGAAQGAGRWRRVLDLGGRILTLKEERAPTDHEIRTGCVDPKASRQADTEHSVELEVSWLDRDNATVQRHVVRGPKRILNHSPHDWDQYNAVIPDEVLLHPSWPPIRKQGENWLKAVKANSGNRVMKQIRWMQMGWVPTNVGLPAFIVGDQVVADPAIADSVVAGIGEKELGVAPHFGVGEAPSVDWNSSADRDTVRETFRSVMNAYVDAKVWTEPSTAALVLAAALRPVVPLRPKSTLFLFGPKGKGKSWTARAMMYFWARDKPDWQDRLPGSAMDTMAFTEKAVSMSPIWVMDDLAPSTSRRQSESATAKLEDLTRNIFNNSAKGRMNADMSSKKTNKPMAQFIATAENELTTPSVKERLIPIYMGEGKLNPDYRSTERINEMAREDGTQAQFTGYLIRFVQHQGARADGGWEGYTSSLTRKLADLRSEAMTVMAGLGSSQAACQRASSLAADVLLTFVVLQEMATELGMGELFIARFGAKSMRRSVIELVHSAHLDNQSAAPGHSIVRALSSLLNSNGANIVSASDPSAPPIGQDDPDHATKNHKLGWSGSHKGLVPNGLTIGTLVRKTLKDTNEEKWVILFDLETAFKAAQEAYPKLIPYGQNAATAWAGVWDEGLAARVTRNKNKNRFTNSHRMRYGETNINGCPVDIDVLFNGGPVDTLEAGEPA